MKKRKSLIVHVDKDGCWIEPDDFDNAMKWDSLGTINKLRKKLNNEK